MGSCWLETPPTDRQSEKIHENSVDTVVDRKNQEHLDYLCEK